jgi:hypothetical protein
MVFTHLVHRARQMGAGGAVGDRVHRFNPYWLTYVLFYCSCSNQRVIERTRHWAPSALAVL